MPCWLCNAGATARRTGIAPQHRKHACVAPLPAVFSTPKNRRGAAGACPPAGSEDSRPCSSRAAAAGRAARTASTASRVAARHISCACGEGDIRVAGQSHGRADAGAARKQRAVRGWASGGERRGCPAGHQRRPTRAACDQHKLPRKRPRAHAGVLPTETHQRAPAWGACGTCSSPARGNNGHKASPTNERAADGEGMAVPSAI